MKQSDLSSSSKPSDEFVVSKHQSSSERNSDVEDDEASVPVNGNSDSSHENLHDDACENSFSSCIGDDQEAATTSPKGREERNRKPPAWHNDYDMHYTGFAYSAMSYVDHLPNSLAEAEVLSDWKRWKAAIQEEISSLDRNKTWTVMKLPPGRTPISCKWVFKVKRGKSRDEDRYKVRLVARGFSQKLGFDYAETYSPVARLDTVRVVLAVANELQMEVHQMDVNTAFLNGHLDEEMYMTLLEGFDDDKHLVCRLNRSLYGLKQASRAWYARFHSYVEKLGFHSSASDRCLYTKGIGSDKVFLVLYVDDLLVVGHRLNAVKAVKKSFSREFEMTYIGEVQIFLGMKIEREVGEKCLRINQRSFLENLLLRFNMQDCKPMSTPMENHLRLKKGEEVERTDKPYRQLIGCLMYITLASRPDLCAAVGYLSQFQSCPTEVYWKHAKRVLRYIKGTLEFALLLRARDSEPVIEAFADADWANDPTDRRSLTGYVFRAFFSTVSWATRKQSTIALSSTEEELVALSVAVCHGKWLIRLLRELDKNPKEPVVYHEDNQSSIRVVEEERETSRSKHVDVKYRFVHEEIMRGQIIVKYVPTGEQIADIMTKGLPVNVFQKHRTSLGLIRYEH